MDGADLFLSVLVLGEIRQGIERLRRRDTAQADTFERWVATLRADFADRLLPVSPAVAEMWGSLIEPDPLPAIDGLLIATALVHDLTLVTRDLGPASRTPVRTLDPFADG